jgi:hypothetical protein
MLITPKQAFEQHLRDIFITTDGIVSEILPDEIKGIQHQRFLIITETGQSLLVVYNIHQNIRLDVKVGLKIHVEGTYVWNRYGGIIHETHSNVNKAQPDGSILIKGNK